MGEAEVVVEVPYAPRPLQHVIHDALDAHRFAVAVCHRRFGKTVLAVNHLQKGAVTCTKQRPRFAYIAPTYTQGKAISWDLMNFYAAPIPGVGINISELRIDYPNGGQMRIFGADNPDSLRGLYFDGVVLDEYGLMPPGIFSEVIRPLIADRLGWVLFIGTPNGKNQFYDIVQQAQREPDWFFAEYRASQTGLIPASELASARQSMTADEYAQEFECSFEASVKGAVFAREIIAAREAGRVTRVPYDPALPVDTDWDLGVGDATAIWFSQTLYSGEVRLIDYYEQTGQGLAHYKQVLNDRAYTYGHHWAPHDIQVREFTTGHSRLEAARALGINFQISPKVEKLEDGIHAARMLLPRCWFDQDHTRRGVECLQHYRWDYNTRINEFTHLPVHDWSCVTGDTEILTRHGRCQIQYLPADGEVLTSCGWKAYENPRITRRAAPLVVVMFSDGLTVKCTPEHRFLTASGWRFASHLQTGSQILSSLTRSRNISMALSTGFGRASAIFQRVAAGYIATCGRWRSVLFPTIATSTIATATPRTISFPTLSASLAISTYQTRGTNTDMGARSQRRPGSLLRHGIVPRLVGSGTVATRSARRAGRSGDANLSLASTAARRWMRWFASLGIRRNTAPKHAKPLRIVSVKPLRERADVWCLTVPDGAMFSLANGAITHNSHGADAFRGLAYRHYTPKYQPERQAAAALRAAQRDTQDVRRPQGGRGGY